jgi:hypothetical protein
MFDDCQHLDAETRSWRSCRWPFGQGIRKRFLPTTVEELHAEREHRTLTVARPAEPLSEQMDPYDTEDPQL